MIVTINCNRFSTKKKFAKKPFSSFVYFKKEQLVWGSLISNGSETVCVCICDRTDCNSIIFCIFLTWFNLILFNVFFLFIFFLNSNIDRSRRLVHGKLWIYFCIFILIDYWVIIFYSFSYSYMGRYFCIFRLNWQQYSLCNDLFLFLHRFLSKAISGWVFFASLGYFCFDYSLFFNVFYLIFHFYLKFCFFSRLVLIDFDTINDFAKTEKLKTIRLRLGYD